MRRFRAAFMQEIAISVAFKKESSPSTTRCPSIDHSPNVTLQGVGVYPGGGLVSHKELLTRRDAVYGPNLNCTWTILPLQASELIHVRILLIDLETGVGTAGSECRYDSLTLGFRNALTGRWEERVLCSRLHRATLTSTGRVVVRFRTDASVGRRGFKLMWFFVPRKDAGRLPGLQGLQLPEVRRTSSSILPTQPINAQQERSTTKSPPEAPETLAKSEHCSLPTPVNSQFGIAGLRGFVLASQVDYFSDTASTYASNLNCSWRLEKYAEKPVLLIKIVSLAMEGSGASGCEFDSLTLQYRQYNQSNVGGTQRQAIFCDPVQSVVLLAASNAQIVFKTDASVGRRGFHLQWASVDYPTAIKIESLSKWDTCTKPKELASASLLGVFAPGGRLLSNEKFINRRFDASPRRGDEAYESNLNCRWRISSPTGCTLLWIRYLGLRTGPRLPWDCTGVYDRLTLRYKSAISGQRKIRHLCGFVRNVAILAGPSGVELRFQAHSTLLARGFDIQWLYPVVVMMGLLGQT